MRGKAALLIGAAAGYVLGARAGRERYEAIKDRASTTAGRVRRDPRVQDAAAQAKDKAAGTAAHAATAASEKAGQAKAKAEDAVGRGSGSTGGQGTAPTTGGTAGGHRA